ncbi:MAG: rhodanese-like domain-containing protein [Cyclobacteriaceae bacterium]|nr:rhodanese-like domain-containing protein [Cyclobacteriaceae bacterium SS2]
MRILVFLLVAAATWSCQSQQKKENMGPEEFSKAITEDTKAVVVDVRTDREVAGGMIDGAVHMDINSPDFAEKASKLEKDKTYYVYCLSGGRSSSAASYFKEIGIENVVNLDGGIRGWQNSGLPLVKPE